MKNKFLILSLIFSFNVAFSADQEPGAPAAPVAVAPAFNPFDAMLHIPILPVVREKTFIEKFQENFLSTRARSMALGLAYAVSLNNQILSKKADNETLKTIITALMWANILFPIKKGKFDRGCDTLGGYGTYSIARWCHNTFFKK